MSKSLFERPGLSWNEMLKMTKIELALIPDPDIKSFRKLQKVEFLIFPIDAAKPTRNI